MTANDRRRTSRTSAPAAAGLAILLSLTVFPAPAALRAATITTPTQSATIPLTQTNWGPDAPSTIADPVVLPKFDPSLGKLTAVNLGLGATFTHNASAVFDVANATITLQSLANALSVTRPDGSSLISVAGANYVNPATPSGTTFPNDVTFPTQTTNGTYGPLVLTSPADLALFTATKPGDTIALPVSATATSQVNVDTGNGYGSIITNAGATVAVSYTYTPVPEPAAAAVLGFGCLLILAARRRDRGR